MSEATAEFAYDESKYGVTNTKAKAIDTEIADKFPCPEGDIFDFPTRAEITQAFNDIASIPGKLQGKMLEQKAEREKKIADLYLQLENPDLTEEEIAAINEQIEAEENFIKTKILGELQEQIDAVEKDIIDFVDTLSDALSPFWNKGKQNRDWQQEANDAFQELLAEFHTYIPTKIAEIFSKLVPISFKINVLGLEIDVLKLVTNPSYGKELKDQIGGIQFLEQIEEKNKRLAELQKKLKDEIDTLTPEEIEEIEKEITQIREEIDLLYNLRTKWVDKFFSLIPEEFRLHDGEYGVLDDEAKAKLTWKYIKTEIKEWIQNWHMKALQKLIGLFDKIWKLLGLPDGPWTELMDIMNLDIGALIEAKVSAIREKWKKTKLGKQQSIKKLEKEIEEIKEKMANRETPTRGPGLVNINISEEDVKLMEELEEKQEEKKKLEKELVEEAGLFHKAVNDAIEKIEIFGFDILQIIGGEIESTTASIEAKIDEIAIELQDFRLNWHKKIMFDWVKIVKKFLDMIGLGKIFDFLFLTWCNFLKLIGMPMSIGIALPIIGGVISTTRKKTPDHPRTGKDMVDFPDVSYADADGVRTEFDLPDGSGTARVFIDGKEDEMIMEDGGNLLLESVENVNGLGELPDTILLESTQGATIVGNKIIFDTAPVNGTAVSIIKI